MGIEAIDLLGNYAVIAEEQGADLEQRLSERRSDLERAMTLRAEEQGRRDALQAELELARDELARAVESGAEEQGRVVRGSRPSLSSPGPSLPVRWSPGLRSRDVVKGSRPRSSSPGPKLPVRWSPGLRSRDVATRSRPSLSSPGPSLPAQSSPRPRSRAVARARGRATGRALGAGQDAVCCSWCGLGGRKVNHEPPPKTAYDQLVDDVRARVLDLIPSGATVLVASKGDDKLAQLDGRRAWHFPGGPDGRYPRVPPGRRYSGDRAARGHARPRRRSSRTTGDDTVVARPLRRPTASPRGSLCPPLLPRRALHDLFPPSRRPKCRHRIRSP